ncbi:MAG: isoamylase early set domain-containing protein [Bacteroidales bacterium]|nr:isoamylase early set domain-containing protein [Bacteroidales bacterium]MDD4604499.1 isoamylase early set domain-containing protein [Bacteroidales bacterium]
MSIEKKFLKAKSTCKVKFSLSGDRYKTSKSICIAGDFNEWSTEASPLKKSKNGTWSVTLNLPSGRDYQFRYVIDSRQWENDAEADKTVPAGIGDSENSVIVL